MPAHASRREGLLIGKKLEEVLQDYNEENPTYCHYKDGWDDQRVADVLKVKKASVMGYRVECFGKLMPPPGQRGGDRSSRFEDLLKRVDEIAGAMAQLISDNADLQRVNRNLITSYDELKNKHDRLCDTLQINKVADVRHLKVVTQTHLQAHTNAQGRA